MDNSIDWLAVHIASGRAGIGRTAWAGTAGWLVYCMRSLESAMQLCLAVHAHLPGRLHLHADKRCNYFVCPPPPPPPLAVAINYQFLQPFPGTRATICVAPRERDSRSLALPLDSIFGSLLVEGGQ